MLLIVIEFAVVVTAFNGGMGRLPMDVALQGASNAVRVHLKDDGVDDFMNVNVNGVCY